MLSICEIWNKLALRSDPNPGCLCHKKKAEGHEWSGQQPSFFFFSSSMNNEHKVNSDVWNHSFALNLRQNRG